MITDFKNYEENLKKFTDLLTPIPAIPWHTLDMEVQGKKIYDILFTLQAKLSKRLLEVRTNTFFGRENKFDKKLEWYLTNIDTITMHMPEPLVSEKDKDIEDKTIVLGSEPWNNNTMWVDGTVLCRNDAHDRWSIEEMKFFNTKIYSIIGGMKSDFDLSEREATEMVFLRKWRGLYGW